MISKTVTVDVGHKQYILTPTLRALEAVEAEFGDLLTASRQLKTCGAITMVIAAGAGLTGNAAKQMKEEVFNAGFLNFMEPLTEYLTLLANPSGKEPEEGDQGNP